VCNLRCSYVSFFTLCQIVARVLDVSQRIFFLGISTRYGTCLLWLCSFNPGDRCILRNCSVLYMYAYSIYHDNCSKRPISIILMYTHLNCYFMFDLWYFCCVFFCFDPFWKIGIQVDLLEPVSHFLEAARENLTGYMDQGEDSHKAANFYCVPLQVVPVDHYLSVDILWKIILPFSVYNLVYFLLQDFTPEEGRYDVIWIQWCIGQLPDDDFISFFNRTKVTWLWLH